MKKLTLKKLNLIKIFFIALFFFNSQAVFSQFYTTHYIAPAPWQYFSKANEIIIATNSTTTVNIALKKSDGTIITNLTAIKGTPAVYRFLGLPGVLAVHPLNTVVNAAGLIITSDGLTSVNLRNVASDDLGPDGTDANIKGNASLTSFGDAGIGVRYRIGYYRVGTVSGSALPIYTIMAITNGITIKLNGVVLTTLNAGESYLFQAAIGSLVESSSATVMNTSARRDQPGGCGDGTFDQIPPESVLGVEYFLERGRGNNIVEESTVVATKANTSVTVETYSVTGALTETATTVLANAGDFFTFANGTAGVDFTASRVLATNNVVVYSGTGTATGEACEVDISVIAPVSLCGGSNFIETKKFRAYNTAKSLPYFGYVLLQDATTVADVNGVNIETLTTPRHQLGTTGWYLINFTDAQIGNPDIISLSSTARLTVSIVQQGGGFSMAGFFSNFTQQPDDPILNYISDGGCANREAELIVSAGLSPYQWYFNGVEIAGETSNSYRATKTGSYSVASTLVCGSFIQSKPITVTLCTDLEVLKTVDVPMPCIGSNVGFTVKVTNLGPNNAAGLSVNDLLPSGYSFVSATPSTGTVYNSATGVWSIGNLDNAEIATLKVIATVNASGVYTTTAAIPTASQPDSITSNNTASIKTTPNTTPVVPTISTSVATCAVAGSATVSNYNDTLTYTSTPSGLTVGVGGVIAGGTNGSSYKITAQNTSLCSATSASFTYDGSAQLAVPSTPMLTVIQPTCGVSGTIKIVNYLAVNLYSIDGGTYATLASDTFNTTAGTHTIQAKNAASLCISETVTSGFINNEICADDDSYSPVQVPSVASTVGSVTDNDTLNGLAVTGSNTDVTPITTGPLSIDGNGVLTLSPNTVSGTYTIVYQLCETGSLPSNCDTATAIVVVDNDPTLFDMEGCVIKVFNAVSPNNDGKNDELYIRGIECYPDNVVEIYNRWGVLVFEKSHYNNIDNAFRGMSDGRTTIKQSEGLPVGTYFYILKYKDSDAKQHESSGYLYLSN